MKNFAVKIALDILGGFLREKLGRYEMYADDAFAFFRQVILNLVAKMPPVNAIQHALQMHGNGMMNDLIGLLKLKAEEESDEKRVKEFHAMELALNSMRVRDAQKVFKDALDAYSERNSIPKPAKKNPYPEITEQIKRKVKYLMIHTTAGNPNTTPEELEAWFTRPKAQGGRGWLKGGYHWIVDGQGEAHRMYVDSAATNGTKHLHGVSNSETLHIAYTGGRKAGEISEEQAATILNLVYSYTQAYPGILVLGHNQVDKNKACPNFNLPKLLVDNGLPEQNLYPHDHYGTMKRLPVPSLPVLFVSPFIT